MQWPKHCRKRGDSMKKTWLQTWKENLKNRKKLRRYVRALIQLVFFVLMPSAFTAAFSGIKYIFTQIGAGAAIELTSFVSVLLVLILYTIVFGRFFCGFACAFGSLGDAVHALYVWVAKKLKKKPIRLSAKLNVGLQYVKYLVLLLIVALCFTGLYASIRGVSPWDVFSMIHAGNFRLSGYAVGIVLLVLILVGMCVQERFFCRYLCPMGAVFAMLPAIPLFSLYRERTNCIPKCTACSKQCPSSIELPAAGKYEVSGECFQCQKCIDTCPKGNVHCGIKKLKGNEFWFTFVRAALLFGLFAWLKL